MIRVFVWMPSWDWKPYPDAILNVINQKVKDVDIEFTMDNIPQRTPIHIARNILLERFVNSSCDYLWFCDDDNPPLLDVLQKLIDSKKDIVSAIVPLRMYDAEWQALNIFYKDMNWWITNYNNIPKKKDNIIKVANCWTWCVLLSKRVCIDMYKKYQDRAFEFTYKELIYNKNINIVETYDWQDNVEWREDDYVKNELWEIHKVRSSLSEDLTFFNRAKELWYDIYARLDAECYHYNWIPSKRILGRKK